jgi:Na+/H+ antiporter NhaD/arsenite permease-like protein
MLDLTGAWFGYLSLAIFVIAYILVILEETTQLQKSKPVLIAAGLIWALVGMAYTAAGMGDQAEAAAQHLIMEYGELFLFLLVSITYVNTLEERRVFDVLRERLTGKKLSYRSLFWLTGIVAFFLSSVLNNLTTALIMGAVVLAVGTKSPKFIVISCISIVVAANAGGSFSPFGDITTLMVWQKAKTHFLRVLRAIPSIAGELVGACPHHAICHSPCCTSCGP